jgi:hypothetical protein
VLNHRAAEIAFSDDSIGIEFQIGFDGSLAPSIRRQLGALREVLTEMTTAPGDDAVLRERCEELLTKARLKPAEIKVTFLKPFTS